MRATKTELLMSPKEIIMFICDLCNREFDRPDKLGSHKFRSHTDRGKLARKKRGSRGWNKGLTKYTDHRVARITEKGTKTVRDKVSNGTFVPSIMGESARKELSERQSLRNSGGKSKWYYVDGIPVQGTWERNVAESLSKMGVIWYKPKVNKDIIKYFSGGSERSYTPDFYLPEYNTYLEIKGYWWGNDKEKMRLVMEQNPDINILIVEKFLYERIIDGERVW